MRQILSTLLLVLWGLWFGGAVGLFIFINAMFRQDRPLAIAGAPILFLTFERYHLILGAAVLALCGAWIILERSKLKTFVLVAFMAASTAAVVSSAIVTPKIMQLRHENRTQTDEFKRAHGMSMSVYTAEAVMLLIAGIALAGEMSKQRPAARPGMQADQTSPLQNQAVQ